MTAFESKFVKGFVVIGVENEASALPLIGRELDGLHWISGTRSKDSSGDKNEFK